MRQDVKVIRASSFRANFYKLQKSRVQTAMDALVDEALEFVSEREIDVHTRVYKTGSLLRTSYMEELPGGKGVRFGFNRDGTAVNSESKTPVKDYQYEMDERRQYWEIPLQTFMRNLYKNVEARTKGMR